VKAKRWSRGIALFGAEWGGWPMSHPGWLQGSVTKCVTMTLLFITHPLFDKYMLQREVTLAVLV